MIELVIKNQLEKALSAPAYYGDPNKLDFIYSELAFGQLFFVAYSSCLFLADTFTQKFKLVKRKSVAALDKFKVYV